MMIIKMMKMDEGKWLCCLLLLCNSSLLLLVAFFQSSNIYLMSHSSDEYPTSQVAYMSNGIQCSWRSIFLLGCVVWCFSRSIDNSFLKK